jgi:hypothetical protein
VAIGTWQASHSGIRVAESDVHPGDELVDRDVDLTAAIASLKRGAPGEIA